MSLESRLLTLIEKARTLSGDDHCHLRVTSRLGEEDKLMLILVSKDQYMAHADLKGPLEDCLTELDQELRETFQKELEAQERGLQKMRELLVKEV